jgi:AcrR family transcriptional regulator
MATTTRQRLIDAATKRFYRDGFRNVGLDQILDDVNISKTAFYKHFSCKDDLMLEVLEEHNRQFQDFFMAKVRAAGGKSARKQLEATFDVVEQIIEEEGFHGCIFVNASIEFPLPHDPVHEAAVKNKQAIETIIHDIAERAGAADPQALASELCLIIEGAYVTRHVTGNRATIEIARRVAKRAIEAHLNGK